MIKKIINDNYHLIENNLTITNLNSLNTSSLEASLIRDFNIYLNSVLFKYYHIYRKKDKLIDLYKYFILKYVLVLNQKEELKKNHVKKDAFIKELAEELQELKDILIKKDDLIKQLVLENDPLKQSLKANNPHLSSLQEINNKRIIQI